MSRSARAACKVIRPEDTYDGKQGFAYLSGIAKQSVGSTGISMVLLSVPPAAGRRLTGTGTRPRST